MSDVNAPVDAPTCCCCCWPVTTLCRFQRGVA